MRRRRREVYDDHHASNAISAFAIRRATRPGVLWGYLFGAVIAASARSYISTFPTPASRATLARTFETNTGFAALFGPLRRLDTVAGYTAYKTGMFLVILGAIWGLLLATRLTRGEEDAGRWELFLSGRTTRGRATAQAAVGLGAGLVAAWIPTAGLTAAIGATSKVHIAVGTSLFYATAIVAAAAMFMAVGLLVAELAATRHDANLIGAGVLAGAYIIRMVADSDPGLVWLRWASPLGWIEELRPLTGSRPFAFLPILSLVVVLVAVAVRIGARRDLGGSVVASRDSSTAHTLLLGGQAGLTIRLTRPALAAWTAVLVTTGVVFGLVAQAAGSSLHVSPALERVMRRLGGTAAGAESYLGFTFLFTAVLLSIAVAGQVAAARSEEAGGHLDNLIVRPVARWRWLAFRLGVGASLVIVASVLAGLASWAGAASQHVGLPVGDLIKAGINVAPPALFVLGMGGLALGVWPRGATGVAYGLVVWSFAVEAFASLTASGHWLRDTSPLLHITPAPAAAPNWTAAAWLVGLSLLASVAGIAAFQRRDLASG